MAERVQLTGVMFDTDAEGGLLMVPVRQADGRWVVLTYDSTDYYDTAEHALQNAAEMKKRRLPPAEVAAYRLLAEIMAAVESAQIDGRIAESEGGLADA